MLLRKGQKVEVFIELWGFLDDYPSAAHFLDVIKYSAQATCNHISFIYHSRENGSSVLYRTLPTLETVHSQEA